MRIEIPESHRDLLNGPRVAALTTVMPDGQPQTTVVWCNYDGTHVLVNTMRGFRKEKNMRSNPKVTLLCYDPRQPLRSLEVRGTVVEMTEEGAIEHLDGLSDLYTGRKPYFGSCVPAELKGKEIPVLCKIMPTHVTVLDARSKKVEGSRLASASGENTRTFGHIAEVGEGGLPSRMICLANHVTAVAAARTVLPSRKNTCTSGRPKIES
jgi:PPOX class probable F420-dependent enzyme